MTGWSIRSLAIATALASVAAVPALAQDRWSPPPQDDGYQQQTPDDGYQQAPDDGDSYQQGDDQDNAAPQAVDPSQDEGDNGYQGDNSGSSSDDGDRYAPPPAAAPYGDEGNDQGYAPNDADNGNAPDDADGGPGAQDAPPAAPQANAAPQSYDDNDNWREWHDPSAASPATVPESNPGYQRSAGIADRQQAVSGCLTAVRARIGGAASATRVDGIRGEWMVSGTAAGGKPFYCSVRNGAVDGVELGS